MTRHETDHAHEYVPGDPHCVVCYERAEAGPVVWSGMGPTVIVAGDGPTLAVTLTEVEEAS